jgi:hypothetical protein
VGSGIASFPMASVRCSEVYGAGVLARNANANTFLTRGEDGMFPIMFLSGCKPTCFSTCMRTRGIMTAITTTTIVITTEANPTGTTTALTARRSTCIFEQMPVSGLAVMVQSRRKL